ncbi:MAG: PilZ domain-containing protein [Novosphingobium sp.]
MSDQPKVANTGSRKAGRAEWSADVQFRCGNRRAVVQLADISQNGARVKGVFLVRQGDTFYLKLSGMESFEARVVWAEEFEFGCEFLRPLNPVILEALVHSR